MAPPVPASAPQALLFDMGGIVIDCTFERAFQAWQPLSRLSLAQIRERFQCDLAYQRHERGEIDAAAYYAHLASTLQLQAEPAQIAQGWNAIFAGEIAETAALVRAMRGRLPCHAFTNTNAAHMAEWSRLYPGLVQSFDRIFASHQIGLRKPEQAAFDHVAGAIGVAPEAILFFDDLLANVEGARAAGLQAVHVRSPRDVRDALASFGYGE